MRGSEIVTDVAKRNARNRRAGSRWQSDLRNGLREASFDIERLALTGTEDEGDHVVRLGGKRIVIEAKAGTMHPADFAQQAVVEADNFAKHRGLDRADVQGIAVVKRRGASWKQAYVLTTVAEYFGLDS